MSGTILKQRVNRIGRVIFAIILMTLVAGTTVDATTYVQIDYTYWGVVKEASKEWVWDEGKIGWSGKWVEHPAEYGTKTASITVPVDGNDPRDLINHPPQVPPELGIDQAAFNSALATSLLTNRSTAGLTTTTLTPEQAAAVERENRINNWTNTTVGADPVRFAMGDYVLGNTDVSWKVGELTLALERTYYSAMPFPGAAFGATWVSNLDSRIIRGQSPGMNAIRDQWAQKEQAAASDYAAFYVSLHGDPNATPPVTGLYQLTANNFEPFATWKYNYQLDRQSLEAAKSTVPSEAVSNVQGLINELDTAWAGIEPNHNLTQERKVFYHDNIAARDAEIKPLDDLAAAYREKKEYFAGIGQVSADNHDLNTFGGAYVGERDAIGYGYVTLIDETGHPHVYKYDREPVLKDNTVTYANGMLNPYPEGAELAPVVDSDTDTLHMNVDGGFVLRKPDQRVLEYDLYGRLVKVTDRNGNYYQLNRDAAETVQSISDSMGRSATLFWVNGRLDHITLPENRTIRYQYYASGQLKSVEDPVHDTITYEYLGNLLTGIVKPDGKKRIYNYGSASVNGVAKTVLVSDTDEEQKTEYFNYESGHKTVYTNPAGIVETHYFDDNNRETRVDYADGTYETSAYDERGNLTNFRDREGQLYGYQYDGNRNRILATLPGGLTESWTYNNSHQVLSQTARGLVTYYDYDSVGNLVAIRHPDNTREDFHRDGMGRVTKYIDRDRRETVYTYDGYGLVNTVGYPDNSSESFVHDAYGNVLSRTLPTGGTISYQYRADDKLERIDYPDLTYEQFVYSNRKDLTNHRFRDGTALVYSYDKRHLVKTITNALGETISYEYRDDGLVRDKQIKNADGSIALHESYEYDATGRAEKKIVVRDDGSDIVTRIERDGLGRPYRVTDARSAVTRLHYDPTGGIGSVDLPLIEGEPPVSLVWRYDAYGRLVSKTDETTTTEFTDFDRNNRPQTIKNTGMADRVVQYGPTGKITSDTRGRQSARYEYDFRGNPTRAYDAYDRYTRYEYNGLGQMTLAVDRENVVRRYEYDALGQLVGEYLNSTKIKSYAYVAGQLRSVTDAKNHTISYEYDAAGRVKSITDAYQKTWEYAYNALGKLVSTTDPLGNVTSIGYDSAGRATSETTAEGVRRTLEYDDNGNVTRELAWPGIDKGYTYDAQNRVTSLSQPGNPQVRYGYDAAGRLTSERLGEGTPYGYQYDGLGRLSGETDRAGHTRGYTYSPEGWLQSKREFTDQTINYDYDKGGRLVTSSASDGVIRDYGYDKEGRLVRAASPDGTLSFEYDLNGRLSASVDNTTGIRITYAYDENGQRIGQSRTGAIFASTDDWPEGQPIGEQKIDYAYGARGELTAVTDWRNGVTSFGYDDAGRLIRKTLPNAAIDSLSYDGAGRLVGTARRLNGQVQFAEAYVYNAKGQRSLMADSQGEWTRYTYDAAGRLVGAQYPFGGDAAHADQRLVERFGVVSTEMRDYHGGESVRLAQGEFQDLTEAFAQVVPENPAAVERSEKKWITAYTYNEAGNRTRFDSPAGTVNYQYDAFDRLVQAGSRQYQYDAAGNLTQEYLAPVILPDGGPGTGNNGHNNGKGNGGHDNGYGRGNHDGWVDTMLGDQRIYTYTADNRLSTVTMTYPGATDVPAEAATYQYDALGRRSTRSATTLNGADHQRIRTTRTVYDGLGFDAAFEIMMNQSVGNTATVVQNPEPASPDADPSTMVLRKTPRNQGGERYHYTEPVSQAPRMVEVGLVTRQVLGLDGLGGAPLVLEGSDEGRMYPVTDILGSVRGLSNRNGELTDRYEYDAFGNGYNQHGYNGQPYRYGGKPVDALTGLSAYPYRDLDTGVGLWTSLDPVKDGALGSWARYVNSDPVNFTDPLGLDPIAAFAAAGGAIVGAGSAFVVSVANGASADTLLTNVAAGAIGGATAGFAFSIGQSAIAGAAIAGTTDAISQSISSGGNINAAEVVVASLAGGLAGAASTALGSAVAKDALRAGLTSGTAAGFGKTIEIITSGLISTVTGGAINLGTSQTCPGSTH